MVYIQVSDGPEKSLRVINLVVKQQFKYVFSNTYSTVQRR